MTEKTAEFSPEIMVSVVIPARNEASSIGGLIASTEAALSHHPHEIVVVDDASTDGTAAIVEGSGAKLVSHHCHCGKGSAMKTGVLNARGGIIVFMDGDGAHDPQDIPQVIAPVLQHRAALVIGSRRLPESKAPSYSAVRRISTALASHTISIIISFLLPLASLFRYPVKYVRITDCTSGFRAIKKEDWQKLSLISHGFQIETEMVYEAARNGLSIAEVPIRCRQPVDRDSYLFILRDMPKTGKLLLMKLLGETKASFMRILR